MEAVSPTLEEEVIAVVINETGIRAACIRRDMTLFGDMGVDGLDGVDLLRHFEQKFGVDMTTCRLDQHFAPEGFGPWTPLYWLILAWRALVEKGSTPESRARLIHIRVQDLIDSAKSKNWSIQYPEEVDEQDLKKPL